MTDAELDAVKLAARARDIGRRQCSVSVTWALYLGSPVSVPLDSYRPQTKLIARNPRLRGVTDDVCDSDVP